MKKIIFLLCLILLSGWVLADDFIHEGDHNYSILNVSMTKNPYINNYLLLTFNIQDETGIAGKNKHIHVLTYDDRNVLIVDYSLKYSGKDTDIAKNGFAVERSTGYSFYRIIDAGGDNFKENRIVSDDNGFIALNLFLNSCSGAITNCYYQTGNYRVEIKKNSLSHSEYFTVEGENLETYFLIEYLITIGNNPEWIGAIIIIVIFLSVITIGGFLWVKRKLQG